MSVVEPSLRRIRQEVSKKFVWSGVTPRFKVEFGLKWHSVLRGGGRLHCDTELSDSVGVTWMDECSGAFLMTNSAGSFQEICWSRVTPRFTVEFGLKWHSFICRGGRLYGGTALSDRVGVACMVKQSSSNGRE